jgi:hypothetical protein
MPQTDFIKQLYADIDTCNKVNQNPKLFIKHKKLRQHIFNKNIQYIDEDDLPIETIFGSSYLIKGNNILETYAWCDNSYSLYLQIKVKRPMWICNISIVNKDKSDSENLDFLLDGCDVFHSSSNLQYIIVQFIQCGFSLYTKKHI